ncbi:MAG: hypothetical protein HQ567_00475 [Candidatus Nealsonbacteria bacterium]|nr:hypothetical protein [Candidatus Nealsonbacteria bacterium]
MTDKPKRRWYQYSLRSLLVFVVVASIGFSWLATRLKRAKARHQAAAEVQKVAAEIQSLGGSVDIDCLDEPNWFDRLLGDPGVLRVDHVRGGSEFGSLGMKKLKGLNDLRILNLFLAEVTDADLVYLEGLDNIEHLSLRGSPITDAGLKHLEGMTNLRYLNLAQTQVTGRGLEHLKGLTDLNMLVLFETPITDASLKHVKGMTSLYRLYASSTGVTDSGLEYLENLPRLVRLNLRFTRSLACKVVKSFSVPERVAVVK